MSDKVTSLDAHRRKPGNGKPSLTSCAGDDTRIVKNELFSYMVSVELEKPKRNRFENVEFERPRLRRERAAERLVVEAITVENASPALPVASHVLVPHVTGVGGEVLGIFEPNAVM